MAQDSESSKVTDDAPSVTFEDRGQVAWVRLNRPAKHNAQDMAMISMLDKAMQSAMASETVRVVVLSANGPSFSSGHDLTETVSDPKIRSTRASVEGRLALEQRMYVDKCLAIRNLEKPTIAAVHGRCIGAGLMLAVMCDLIVASEDATFSNPALRLGAAGTELLVEVWEVGGRRAKEMLFTGEPISADQALAWGLVNRVVPREELEAEAETLALHIARTPPAAVRLTKRSINAALDIMGQRATWEHHFQVHQLSHATDEAGLIMEERRRAGSTKDWINKRDGYARGESGSALPDGPTRPARADDG